jgi:hypothetical protein
MLLVLIGGLDHASSITVFLNRRLACTSTWRPQSWPLPAVQSTTSPWTAPPSAYMLTRTRRQADCPWTTHGPSSTGTSEWGCAKCMHMLPMFTPYDAQGCIGSLNRGPSNAPHVAHTITLLPCTQHIVFVATWQCLPSHPARPSFGVRCHPAAVRADCG